MRLFLTFLALLMICQTSCADEFDLIGEWCVISGDVYEVSVIDNTLKYDNGNAEEMYFGIIDGGNRVAVWSDEDDKHGGDLYILSNGVYVVHFQENGNNSICVAEQINSNESGVDRYSVVGGRYQNTLITKDSVITQGKGREEYVFVDDSIYAVSKDGMSYERIRLDFVCDGCFYASFPYSFQVGSTTVEQMLKCAFVRATTIE